MNSKNLHSYWFAVLFLCLPIPPQVQAAQVDDRELIDMSLRDASLVDVLQSFAKISGCELKLDPEVTGTITVQLKRTPWTVALDQVCRIHQLSCEILAGEPPVLRVRKLEADRTQPSRLPGYKEAINLSLKGADLRAVLESMEVISGRSMTIDEGIDGEVTLHVVQAPWPVVLSEICRMSGCRIEWGTEEIRIVAASEERRLHVLDLTLSQADLVTVLKSFAKLPIFGADQLEVEIEEGLTGALSVDLKNTAWSLAIEEICERAGCLWEVRYGDPPVLRFSARDPDQDHRDSVAVFLSHPPAGAKPPAVTARFHPPGRAAAVEGDVSFSWTRPIHMLDAVGDDPWQAKLIWIPLGPDLQLVLPIIVRCRGTAATVEVLDPVHLPLTERWTGQRGGARLELRPAAPQTGSQARVKPVEECLPAPGITVEASLRRAGSPALERELRTEVGAYLLVTPPVGEPDPSPTAAVVAIGHDREGRQLLAVVTPAAGGSGVEVEPWAIPPGETDSRIIRASDGREFELELRVDPTLRDGRR